MPTYEYECKSCSHNFEVFQSMSDLPLKDCPECGNEVRRLILGGTGVIFKGSGFYVTDKSKSAKTASKKTDGGASPCAQCPAGGEAGKCPAASEPQTAKPESKSA
jgi:putative FmdB family regulatory protein